MLFFRFERLVNLEELELGYNAFCELPASVCRLPSLRELSLTFNTRLTTLSNEIVRLQSLKYLEVDNCELLVTPPKEVCSAGIESIREYYLNSTYRLIDKITLLKLV